MTTNRNDFDERVLDAIATGLHANGFAPTVRELAAECGVKSTSTITLALDRLAAANRITHTPNKARTLRIVEQPPVVEAGSMPVCPECYSQHVFSYYIYATDCPGWFCNCCGAVWPKRSETNV